jgi:NADH:ubiquinone oxidoreductase subunit E
MPMKDDKQKEITKIITKHLGKKDFIPLVLSDLKNIENPISKETLVLIAEKSPYSLSQLYEFTTFYDNLNKTSSAKYSLILYYGGSAFANDYTFMKNFITHRIKKNKDKTFSLTEIADSNLCFKTPALKINQTLHTDLTLTKLAELLNSLD